MPTRAPVCLLLLPAIAVAQERVHLLPHLESLSNAAYDNRRNRVVLFDRAGETWEIDSGEWLHRAPPGPTPSARTGAAMAFDSVRGHVVMFGGDAWQSIHLSDTWAYDGTSWRLLANNLTGALQEPVMVFDSGRQRLVLVAELQTIEHDGIRWVPVPSPAPTPPAARFQRRMTYDSARGVSVLCGEDSVGASRLCEWDGQSWVTRSAPLQPLRPKALTFDPTLGRVLAIGAGTNLDELWEWDGASWSLRTHTSAATMNLAAGWHDGAAGRTQMVIPQLDNGAITLLSASWDGNVLTTQSQGTKLLPKLAGASVFTTSSETVLVGGRTAGNPAQSQIGTWIRTATGWRQSPTTTTPPPRISGAAASSIALGYLFGGQSPSNAALGDFWEWNGQDWNQLPSGPPPRHMASLAADPLGGHIVLFGGIAQGVVFGDTWLWDGIRWRQHAGSMPTARFNAPMAFDPLRGVAVLFGGEATTAPPRPTDTWVWNGSQWHQHFPATSPTALLALSHLTYDWARYRMLLSGNTILGQDQTWVLTEAGWVLRAALTEAFAFSDTPRGIYDWQAQAVAITNGGSLFEWSDTPTTTTTYDHGCGAAPPRIAMRQRARTGAASGFELYGRSQLPCVFVLDGTPAALWLGNGCSQLVANTSALWFSTTNAFGVAATPIDIPADIARGVPLFVQGVILDPTAVGGFATTAGLRVTIGN